MKAATLPHDAHGNVDQLYIETRELRLQGFLRRNGHPHQQLNPETDAEAKALIERFHIDTSQLPIVVCPDGEFLRNPNGRIQEDTEPGVYRWRQIVEGRLSLIELDALDPNVPNLHRVIIHRTS